MKTRIYCFEGNQEVFCRTDERQHIKRLSNILKQESWVTFLPYIITNLTPDQETVTLLLGTGVYYMEHKKIDNYLSLSIDIDFAEPWVTCSPHVMGGGSIKIECGKLIFWSSSGTYGGYLSSLLKKAEKDILQKLELTSVEYRDAQDLEE